jgi:hypothetical protein
MIRAGRRSIACMLERTSFVVLAVALVVLDPPASLAQVVPAREPPAVHIALAIPIIKVLAIGTFTAKASPKLWEPILPSEVRETVRLYLAGRIDQWYVQPDQSGVVFILNVTDLKAAHQLLDGLPLGQAGLMKFQFIPLGPLSPLRLLLSEPTK